MLLVLPVCHLEIAQAGHLAAWMHLLGGMEKTRCLVVQTFKAQWDIPPILESLRTTFGTVDVWQPPLEDESGWPISSNTMFQQTAEFLEESGNAEPWFWFECDVCPLSVGYWAALEQEYEVAKSLGKIYMGTVNPSLFKYILGPLTGTKFIEGHHMVGAGIYPPDFWRVCKGIRGLTTMAFDVQLGKEIDPFVYNTPLLAHRWQTEKYHRDESGLITMDDVDKDENHYGGRVLPLEAVVAHGCKDTSLIDLLAREHLLRTRKAVG